MTLKEILLRIADGDTKVPGWRYTQGLCSNIAIITGWNTIESAKQMDAWVRDWEHRAPNRPTYPVPYSHKELCHVRAMKPNWGYKAGCSHVRFSQHRGHPLQWL